jgi:hypothetical protein
VSGLRWIGTRLDNLIPDKLKGSQGCTLVIEMAFVCSSKPIKRVAGTDLFSLLGLGLPFLRL